MEDALTLKGDEGRGVTAISLGKVCSNLWSGDFRMGKPSAAQTALRAVLAAKFKNQNAKCKI